MDASNKRRRRSGIVERIVEKVGGQSALARQIGIRPQSVRDWIEAGSVPPLRVLQCERASGMPRSKIRPDIYPPPETEQFTQ